MNKSIFLILLFLYGLFASVSGMNKDLCTKSFIHYATTNCSKDEVHNFKQERKAELELVHLTHRIACRTTQVLKNYGSGSPVICTPLFNSLLLQSSTNTIISAFESSYLFHIYPTHNFW